MKNVFFENSERIGLVGKSLEQKNSHNLDVLKISTLNVPFYDSFELQ